MKIVFVLGGSYKSFYLNYFLKLKRCDILVFNFNVLYDVELKKELQGQGIVFNELKELSKKLGAIVVAGVNVNTGFGTKKCIVVCNGEEIKFRPANIGTNINFKRHNILIGNEKCNKKNDVKIILSEERICPNVVNCSPKKVYIFCDKFGLIYIQNRKMKRKFYKYSKIILK